MQRELKISLFLLGTLIIFGAGGGFYFVTNQLSQRISFQEETSKAKEADLNAKIDQLQSGLKQMTHSHQLLQDSLVKLEDKQRYIQDHIDQFSTHINEIQESTKDQLKDLVRLTDDLRVSKNELEIQSKEWIKESIATLASFESNQDANNNYLNEIINIKLPALNKAVDDLKDQQQQANALELNGSKVETKRLSVLEGKINDLDKKLSDLQEKTLDVILKSDTLRRF